MVFSKKNSLLWLIGVVAISLFSYCSSQQNDMQTFSVNIKADINKPMGKVNHIWRFFGADEPNYAYMKNGKKLLNDLGRLKNKEVYFRAHNMLTTGKGTYALKWGSTNVYTEDENGNPLYDWTIVDSIFDSYIENGARPYVEIGFMPKALSVKPEPYRHYWTPELHYDSVYTGWAYPPTDYKKWEELVYQWTLHCVERYGKTEVEQWYWQTWNEPNIKYWQGTEEEFLKLHDYAIQGVLKALPTAKVGGPDCAGFGGDFTRNFINHCLDSINYASEKKGTKLDFIAFHAKGKPNFDSGYVQMNMGQQLSTIEQGFKLISSIPDTHKIPIIIGESDPDGCAACQGEHLGYRNGTMYSSYTAASFVRKLDLADKYKVNLEGALTWAFEFEEQPYFAGFRALATNGINKPVFNVFKMFSIMQGERVSVESDSEVSLEDITKSSVRKHPDVSAYVSFDKKKIYALLWHYHDNNVEGKDADINFLIENLPVKEGTAKMSSFIVDKKHSNSYTKWLEMGSPQNVTPKQYDILEKTAELEKTEQDTNVDIKNSQIAININLALQGVALYVLEIL